MKFGRREGVLRQRPPRSYKTHLQESDHVIPIRELVTGSRKSRRKKSFSSQKVTLILFIVISFNIMELANGKSCGYDEMLHCNGAVADDCRCVKCSDCPPGKGLYPQCGSTTLRGNMTMKCLPCKNGTYSDQKDFESCHACRVCDQGQDTLRKCSASQNAICSEGCKDGFQWDDIYHRCEKEPTIQRKEKATKIPITPANVSSLTPTKRSHDDNNATEPNEGINKTTPINPPHAPYKHNWISKIEVAFYIIIGVFLLSLLIAVGYWKRMKIIRTLCHLYCSCRGLSTDQQDPVEMFPMNPGQLQDEQELDEITVDPTDRQRRDMDTVQMNSSPSGQPAGHDWSEQPEQPGQGLKKVVISGHSDLQTIDQNHPISSSGHLGECSDQGAGSAQHQRQGLEVISSPLEQKGEGVEKANEMPDIPNLCGLLWSDLSPELKHNIKVKISKKGPGLKGWIEIGRLFEVNDDLLEEIETRCSYGPSSELPGEQLFHILETSKPRLSLKELIASLEHIERKDVICYIHEKMS